MLVESVLLYGAELWADEVNIQFVGVKGADVSSQDIPENREATPTGCIFIYI